MDNPVADPESQTAANFLSEAEQLPVGTAERKIQARGPGEGSRNGLSGSFDLAISNCSDGSKSLVGGGSFGKVCILSSDLPFIVTFSSTDEKGCIARR